MKQQFHSPTMRVVKIDRTDLLLTSGPFTGQYTLGIWSGGGNPWDGSLPAYSGSGMGGWTDNGGSAWE